jgi:hypothetical protein
MDALTREWYGRLKETGFRDIENKAGMIDDHPERHARRTLIHLGDERSRVFARWTHTRRWKRMADRIRWVLVTEAGHTARALLTHPAPDGHWHLWTGRGVRARLTTETNVAVAAHRASLRLPS